MSEWTSEKVHNGKNDWLVMADTCGHYQEIARVWYCGDEVEAEANARLIAAAPDLLAALKDAEKYEWHEGSCSVFARLQEDCDCSVMDFVKLARAAIAKAEGETT